MSALSSVALSLNCTSLVTVSAITYVTINPFRDCQLFRRPSLFTAQRSPRRGRPGERRKSILCVCCRSIHVCFRCAEEVSWIVNHVFVCCIYTIESVEYRFTSETNRSFKSVASPTQPKSASPLCVDAWCCGWSLSSFSPKILQHGDRTWECSAALGDTIQVVPHG